MRPRRVLAGVVSLLAAVSVVAAPQAAAAAQCVYNRVDLPLPAGVTSAQTEGSSTNNSRIVGSYRAPNISRAVYWVNSTLRELPPATSPFYDVFPEAVNNTSVVVGRQEWRYDLRTASQAFRYENGAYQFLETAQDENSTAYGVNDAGDVVGTVWKKTTPAERTVVMWPRNGARKSFGLGHPVGINTQRKIAAYDDQAETSVIINADTGARIEIGGRPPMVLDNDRVLNYEYFGQMVDGQISEWDLSGVRVADHARGWWAYGKNNSGTVFGNLEHTLGGGPTLWRPNSRGPVVADKLPSNYYYGDVTDAATLIGSWKDDAQNPHPARWLWLCS